MSIIDDIVQAVGRHQQYHTQFQMDNFITKKSGGTQYGQYLQATHELYSRFHRLRSLLIDRLEAGHAKVDGRVEKLRELIKFEAIEADITHTTRELVRFFLQVKALKEKLGEFTPERVEKLECAMWLHRVKVDAAVSFIATGRCQAGVVATIQAMPPLLRKQARSEIFEQGPEKLIDWFYKYDNTLPKLEDTDGIRYTELIQALGKKWMLNSEGQDGSTTPSTGGVGEDRKPIRFSGQTK